MKFEQVGRHVLSLFRMVTGLLFFCHGMASIFGVLGGNRGTGEAIPFGTWPGWWAAAIQLIFGGLVLAGLFTRVSALLCSGSMAYAYFSKHQSEGLFPIENGGEAAAMFCWAFLLIAFLGAGKWSLDSVFGRAEKPADQEQKTPVAA